MQKNITIWSSIYAHSARYVLKNYPVVLCCSRTDDSGVVDQTFFPDNVTDICYKRNLFVTICTHAA
jgi:hypothetical protein